MQESVIDGIGLNTTSLPDGRLDLLPAMLARWRAVGCTHVELTARRLDLVVGGRLVAARCDAVGAMVAEAGLKPVLHANHAINLMDREADFHEACAKASIRACARLGGHSMVLHSGKVSAAAFAEDAPRLLAAERERLTRLGDLAGRHGVRLAVENMIAPMPEAGATAYGARPTALAEQLDAVAHEWVGACLDFGHAFLSARRLGFDYLAEIEALSPFVWHLHLHDNCGRSGRSNSGDAGDDATLGFGDMHAPMFLGRIPWGELLPRVRFRPRTFGGIELNGRYNAEAATVVATAHAIAAHLNTGAPLADPYAETVR